jgi:hypothetical protein
LTVIAWASTECRSGRWAARNGSNTTSGKSRFAIYHHFHESKDKVAEKLEARGRKVTTTYGHRRYNGPTAERTPREGREDINGEIFVDLRSFYQDFPNERLRIGVLLPT